MDADADILSEFFSNFHQDIFEINKSLEEAVCEAAEMVPAERLNELQDAIDLARAVQNAADTWRHALKDAIDRALSGNASPSDLLDLWNQSSADWFVYNGDTAREILRIASASCF